MHFYLCLDAVFLLFVFLLLPRFFLCFILFLLAHSFVWKMILLYNRSFSLALFFKIFAICLKFVAFYCGIHEKMKLERLTLKSKNFAIEIFRRTRWLFKIQHITIFEFLGMSH